MKGVKMFPVTSDIWSRSILAHGDLDRASHTLAILVENVAYKEPNNTMVPDNFQSDMVHAAKEVFEALATLRKFMDSATSNGIDPIPYEPSPIPYPPNVQP